MPLGVLPTTATTTATTAATTAATTPLRLLRRRQLRW
jgi:hypothetical protein